MLGLESELLIIFAAIFAFAAFVHGSTAFGFPMVATPLLALVSDIHTAILLTLIPTVMVNLLTIVSEGDIVKALRQHFALAALAMLGAGLGTLVLLVSSPHFFEALLGLAILAYLIATRIKLKFAWIRQYPRASKTLMGLMAGMLGGLTNVMAPVLIIYAMESRYSKKELIQASNMCFLFGKAIQLAVFSSAGEFGLAQVKISGLMLLVAASALLLGMQIRKRIHPEHYMTVLRGLLLLLSLSLLWKAFG